MPITIRIATPADASILAGVRRTWSDEQGSHNDANFESRFATWLAAEAAHRVFWLAELDGDAVGMVNLLVFEQMPWPGQVQGRWGYVGNMFVDRGLRDRGIGRLLLDAAVAYARDHQLLRIVLHPSARSVPFYERAGFAPATSLLLLEL